MNPFAPDYITARQMFLGAGATANATLESVQHPLRGPAGERLHVDVAWAGARAADSVLVLFSGTHGVEGYCGSGVQIATLTELARRSLDSSVAVMLVHAVNPYGFAWNRRVNEDGIDLGRNFLDFSGGLPDNPDYDDSLARALVPSTWDGPP